MYKQGDTVKLKRKIISGRGVVFPKGTIMTIIDTPSTDPFSFGGYYLGSNMDGKSRNLGINTEDFNSSVSKQE